MTDGDTAQQAPIDRSDLEAKLREIEGVVVDVEEDVQSKGAYVAIGVAVVVVGLVAFSIWRRRRNRIRVEVYHL